MTINLSLINIARIWQTLRNQPIKAQSLFFSGLGWGIYLLLAIIYCQFYITYVAGDKPGLFGSLIWAIQESSIWIICTPFLFFAFSRLWQKHKFYLATLFIVSFLLAVTYRITLALYMNNNSLIENLIAYIPVNFTITVFVFLCARLLFPSAESLSSTTKIQNTKNTSPITYSSLNNCHNSNDLSLQKNKILHVQTGTQELGISINEIESISAAGNYMEVSNGKRTYILRTTMKTLEEELQSYSFIRIHRSHLINRFAIQQIKNNQDIILKSGQCFPLTKRYKKNIL